jgi:hypothetical protein
MQITLQGYLNVQMTSLSRKKATGTVPKNVMQKVTVQL